MDKKLEDLVHRRAEHRCEYCRLPIPPFHIEHIIARKHGGASVGDNLALACIRCNAYKGPNLAGIDPASGRTVKLFHPRRHRWRDHFRSSGPRLIGKTPTGRATVAVLQMNHPQRIELRRRLIDEGRVAAI